MKALIFHGPGRMSWEDAPDPEPGEGEAVVEVGAVGICGSDLHGYTGANSRRTPGLAMGHEAAGRVAALGGGITPDWLGEGRFDPSLLVTGERPMAEGAAVFQELTTHQTEGIKTVLVA